MKKHINDIHSCKEDAWDFWHLDFVPKGCVVLLVGAGGSGKSTFMSWLADEICSKDCRVLIVSNEETDSILSARAKHGSEVKVMSRFSQVNNEKITAQDVLDVLDDFDVIFVDSLRTITDIDYRYSQKVEEVFDPFIKAVSNTNKTIIFLHHPNKGGGDSLQDVIAGSERMVSIVRHCDLTINDVIGERRIITVAKSNCFSENPGSGSHSFIISAVNKTLQNGSVIKVVDRLTPFNEDLEEVLWRNSKKGKEAKYKQNLLKELSIKKEQTNNIEIPKHLKSVLIESGGNFIDKEFLDSMGKNMYHYFNSAVNKTGRKWITKERNGAKVIYHWTDEAKKFLKENL